MPLIALVQRVGRGDREAFRALYDATSAKLFGTILRILGDRDASRDILQEVYVKIWQNAAAFDSSKASPITWMATIARNRAIDEARRVSPLRASITTDDIELVGEDSDPLAARSQGEDMRQVLGCLDGLDDTRRRMVLLAYCHGFSREALAEKFGHPVATVKTWLRRSLLQLRECLDS
jgi:RNA polymerase sigma-70 factor (ECF subfamily)